MKITIYNERHGTRAEVETKPGPTPNYEHITKAQVGYVRSVLCPKKNCDCAAGPSKELNGCSPKNPIFFAATDGSGWIQIKQKEKENAYLR